MRRQPSEAAHGLSTDTRFTLSEGHATSWPEVPALTLLAHPDPRRIGEVVTLPEMVSGETVRLSRLEPLFAAPGSSDVRPLGEPHLSRKPLHLAPVRPADGETLGTYRLERQGSPTQAAVDGQPLGDDRRLDAEEIARGAVLKLGRHVALLLHLQPALTPRLPHFGLVGESSAILRLRHEIQLAAKLDTSVLLRGASGTGKELVARAIHDAGKRGDQPWVSVNMAAIPSTLAAAELFGARKGAYTGANRSKQGFFTAADGGTLFLDEVGDTPPDIQPLLLRTLESGEIQPVGSAETRQVDVRVIAATDADLDNAIVDGRFRAPLLHRLAGWEIRLPPLVSRRADIGRLLVHFLTEELRQLGAVDLQAESDWQAAAAQNPWASASLLTRLACYDWPGNVRQLRNVARRLAITHQADPGAPLAAAIEPLLTATLAHPLRPQPPAANPAPEASPESSATTTAASPTGRWRPVYRKASEISEDELLTTLRAQRWDLKPTAEALGVSRSVLYQLIDRCPRVRTAAQIGSAEIEIALHQHGGDIAAAAAALEVSRQGLKLRLNSLGLR
ncbi:MAG: sigma 54-interacting transcriptional regulator [Acidobacteriota bacterium]